MCYPNSYLQPQPASQPAHLTLLPNPLTRLPTILPNPRPHRLANPNPQPRHRAHKQQRDDNVDERSLAFTQIPPPALGLFGFGLAEEGLFAFALGFVGVVGNGLGGGDGVDGDAGVGWESFFEVVVVVGGGRAGVEAGFGLGGAGVAIEGAEGVGGGGVVGFSFGHGVGGCVEKWGG